MPLLLREVITFGWNFPPERWEVDAQFAYLGRLSQPQLREAMRQFADPEIVTGEMQQIRDWSWLAPLDFSEQLSAELWTTGQISAFRTAAVELLNRVHTAVPPPASGDSASCDSLYLERVSR